MATKKTKTPFKNRFSSKKSAKWFQNRIVSIGGGEAPYTQQIDPDTQVTFCDNKVRSSKYTLWSFWFLNLFEQFRRVANFYFLIVAIIQLSLPSPPVSPFTSVSPLVFVVVVTMIKQGYEDFCRHRADREINLSPVNIIQGGQVVQARSQDIKVGDIVMVRENQNFPADLVLLATPSSSGKCFVMTANLDGETNLKPLSASTLTKGCKTPEELGSLSGQIECENPTPDLLSFLGRIKINKSGDLKVSSLSLDNLVMRGTQLRNTEYVYGCAVYTGRDTKMTKNSKITGNKFSTVEKTMNKFLLFFMGLLLLEIIVSTSLKYTYGIDTQEELVHWYMGDKISVDGIQVAQDFFSYLVIYNYIIPISLYVTLEFQKFFGSLFLVWDLDLYDAATGEQAKCNSSDLNEELGQIEILFTDKTGTLTENIMIFKEASINGRQYSVEDLVARNSSFSDLSNHKQDLSQDEDSFLDDSYRDPQDEILITEFLSALCVCHTVQAAGVKPTEPRLKPRPGPRTRNGVGGYDNPSFDTDVPETLTENCDIQYNASSPDEKALVEACQRFGVIFTGEKETSTEVSLHVVETRSGSCVEKVYTRLHVLDFDSTRKRMSVIVQDPQGRAVLVTKGAESSVIPRCIEGPLHETNKHIDEYALVGLRTLAVASRQLAPEELLAFQQNMFTAQQAIEGRDAKIMSVYDEMEHGLSLLGATAVEDKLQFGVKDTLVKLGQAGISVWILTGDKKETAINISYSCGHLLPTQTVLDLTGLTSTTITGRLERTIEQLKSSPEKFGLVVDGAALNLIMPFKDNKDLLFQIASKCDSVVCCRMSPLQKSEIVRMMKNAPGAPVTAAIGDGGNDVAMIQEAHVGLGIMGKEGRAAVRAADFAFSKFHYLQKVVLVHGHWYYYRVALLVQYFFYKNVACFTCQFYYAFYNNFSTQTLFDGISLSLYNISYTSLPIFLFALMEQNLDKSSLLDTPQHYRRHYRNKLLRWNEFFLWFCQAVWHSVVFFFGWYLFWSVTPAKDGLSMNVNKDDVLDQASFGVAVYSSVVTLVNLRLIFQSRSWNIFLVLSIIASVLFYIGFTFLCHSIRIPTSITSLMGGADYNPEIVTWVPVDYWTYWVYQHTLSSPTIWLFTTLLLVIAILPDIVIRVLRKHWISIREGAQRAREKAEERLHRGNYELNNIYNHAANKSGGTVVPRSIVRTPAAGRTAEGDRTPGPYRTPGHCRTPGSNRIRTVVSDIV